MPDPDLEIRGGRSSRPLDGPHFGLRIKGGQPPGCLPWIRHYIMIFGSLLLVLIAVWWCMG